MQPSLSLTPISHRVVRASPCSMPPLSHPRLPPFAGGATLRQRQLGRRHQAKNTKNERPVHIIQNHAQGNREGTYFDFALQNSHLIVLHDTGLGGNAPETWHPFATVTAADVTRQGRAARAASESAGVGATRWRAGSSWAGSQEGSGSTAPGSTIQVVKSALRWRGLGRDR